MHAVLLLAQHQQTIAVFKDTVADSIGICILLATATLFGNVITRALIPQTIVKWAMSFMTNKTIFLITLNIMLLIVGMFMETTSAITILTPIIFPLATAFGVNGIQLGVLMVLNLMIGVISPPFGVVLFAINRVGQISFGRLVKALIPWFAILLVALAIITAIPWITTWLPSCMGLGGLK